MIPRRSKKEVTQKYKIVAVGLIFCVALVLMLLRASSLHLSSNPKLKKWAKRGYEKLIELSPQRGEIFDAKNVRLASSISVKSVYANPKRLSNKGELTKKLSKILRMDRKQLSSKLNSEKYFVWLARKVDPLVSKQIEELKVKGLGTVEENKRFYPNMELASNVLGFTGVDSTGLYGIELEYEGHLNSKKSKYKSLRDALGRTIFTDGLYVREFDRGNNIYLNIDRNIQYIAEKELEDQMRLSGAKRGYVIMMDPYTGKILALVSRPNFNPNEYRKYHPSSWINGTVSLVYEPGSTMKTFVIAAALEEGIIKPDDLFFCKKGSFSVAGKTINDSSDRGWLTPSSIIKFSSNIGAAKIAMLLGKEKLFEWMQRFGFTEPTQIDLPGEAKGILRHYSKWSSLGVANIGFGQGIAVTPIQMITSLSIIANGGFKVTPFIVNKIEDRENNIIFLNEAKMGQRIISESTAATIRNFMVGVTENEGTGQKGHIDGYSVAGKTGTAQKIDPQTGTYSQENIVVSFMGFVPAKKPKIAMLVILDDPKENTSGGALAAPVFRKVAQKTLKYMGIHPVNKQLRLAENLESSMGHLKEDLSLASFSRNNLQELKKIEFPSALEFGEVPDFSGLSIREVLRIAQSTGMEIIVEGSGRAFKQTCSKVSKIQKKNRCNVYFRPI